LPATKKLRSQRAGCRAALRPRRALTPRARRRSERVNVCAHRCSCYNPRHAFHPRQRRVLQNVYSTPLGGLATMATDLKREGATPGRIEELLGADARALLDYTSQTIPKDQLHLPGPDFVDRIWTLSDRSPRVLRSLH